MTHLFNPVPEPLPPLPPDDPQQLLIAQNKAIIDLLDAQLRREQNVKIVNFNMPFLALVGILVKIALASIPAMIIVAITIALLSAVFGGVLGGLLR